MKHIIIALVILLALAVTVNAQVPQTMNHQGYLTDSSGTPIHGSVSITFSLYDVATGGTSLWSQTQTVNVNQGVYSAVLGGGANPQPLDIPFDTQYYLGIAVGTDTEMTPRQMFASVPYAFSAINAHSVDGQILNGNSAILELPYLTFFKLEIATNPLSPGAFASITSGITDNVVIRGNISHEYTFGLCNGRGGRANSCSMNSNDTLIGIYCSPPINITVQCPGENESPPNLLIINNSGTEVIFKLSY